jgi:hypothetical protein
MLEPIGRLARATIRIFHFQTERSIIITQP